MRGGCTDAGLEPKPRWTHPRIDPDSRDACFTLGSASVRDFSRVRRVRRLGLGPRSLPVDLAIDPAVTTGGGACMGPAVVAYQLLQPVKERRTSTTVRALILAARRGPQPSSRFVPRGDSPLARDEADGPRATCSGEVTPDSLSPRKGLGEPDMSPTIHLDDALRRRLPMALAAWAGRPSEGFAPLGWLREFPSSAPPVHPFRHRCVRHGGWRVPMSEICHRSRPSLRDPSAKKSPITRTRVLSTANGPPGTYRSLDAPRVGSVSPHAAPTEGALRTAPPPFPVEATSLGF